MFSLAKELGMTVSQLSKEITIEEVIGWSAYFSLKDDEERRERDRVQNASASRVQTR
jgi:hypothetical protein